jgi:hypothetical protein
MPTKAKAKPARKANAAKPAARALAEPDIAALVRAEVAAALRRARGRFNATAPVEVADPSVRVNPDVTTVSDQSTDGNTAPYPRRKTDPRKQYAAAGQFPVLVDYKRVLARTTDDAEAAFGDRLYDFMDASDAAVHGSLVVLATTTLAQGVTLVPAKAAEPGEDPEADPEAKQALEVAEFNERLLANISASSGGSDSEAASRTLTRSVESILFEVIQSALKHGCQLAELTWKVNEDGIDAGRMTLASLKTKPRTAWAFVVDAYYDVQGLLVASPEEKGWVVLDTEKFAILQWDVRNNDPRGSSLLRQSYMPWNMRFQTWPEFFKFLQRFAGPSIIGKLPPEAAPKPAVSALDGLTPDFASPDVSAEEEYAATLEKIRGGACAAIPHGAEAEVLEAKSDGAAFERALDLLRREIVSSILLAARATMEAKNGSKADSETAGDVTGNLIRFLRQWAAGWIREILYKANCYNFGREVAEAFTPTVSLGDVEHQDIAELLDGIAALMRGNYFTEGQLPSLDAMLGLPVRSAGDERTGQHQHDENGNPIDPADAGKDEGDDDSNDAKGGDRKAGRRAGNAPGARLGKGVGRRRRRVFVAA